MYDAPDALMHGLIDVVLHGHPCVTSVVVTSYAAPVTVLGRLDNGMSYEFRVDRDASLRVGTSPLGMELAPTHEVAVPCASGLTAHDNPQELVELFTQLIRAVHH